MVASRTAGNTWTSVASKLLDPVRACYSAGFCDSAYHGVMTGDALPCHVCKKLATFIDTDILEDPAVQVPKKNGFSTTISI